MYQNKFLLVQDKVVSKKENFEKNPYWISNIISSTGCAIIPVPEEHWGDEDFYDSFTSILLGPESSEGYLVICCLGPSTKESVYPSHIVTNKNHLISESSVSQVIKILNEFDK